MTAKRKLAPLPKMRPGRHSLWAVMNRVCKEIRKEPLRFDMRDWLATWKGEVVPTVGFYGVERRVSHLDNLPACGTVGCFAGWGGILMGKKIDSSIGFLREFMTAREHRLFSAVGQLPDDLDRLDTLFSDTYIPADPGTSEYAEIVLRKFEAFMHQNEKALRRRFATVR